MARIIQLDNLNKKLGLHYQIEIIYVVDGFEASLIPEEGYNYRRYDSHGESIESALQQLENLISMFENK